MNISMCRFPSFIVKISSGLRLILILFMATAVQAERKRMSLDEDWTFNLGDPAMAQDAAFDDSGWRTLNVPHDWSIECGFSKTNSHRNAWMQGGIGWYRKQFTLPASDEGRHVELQFDGVYKHARVWVNGEPVGFQGDGYTSFYFDITPHVHFGKPNTIAVRVDNSVQPNCRWYTGSGIYRHVWLTVKDPLHVENWGTAVTTPVITKSEAAVQVQTELANRGSKHAKFELETRIMNDAGEQVAATKSAHLLGPDQTIQAKQDLQVFSPKLWSLESTTLYTAISRITAGGKVLDEYSTPFGIREIRFDAKNGFFLNGENMKMKGVCLHSDAGTFGAAVPERVWEVRLQKLKSMGVNAVRTAHNAMAPEFMDLCDEIGLLVMDEFVDKWDHPEFADPYFHTEWQRNFGETVRRDRNHPSVVIWSVGNENHHPGTPEQNAGLEAYCNYVRSIDSSRPVVSGMPRPNGDPEKIVDGILDSCRHMDLIGMNYGLQWSKRIADRNPGMAFVSTESYVYYGSTETDRWAFLERPPWFDVEEHDSNIGLFLWAGIKYLGEIPAVGKNPDSWPNIFCWPGAFLDSAGFRLPESYYYESLWTDEPMVYTAVIDHDAWHNKRWGVPVMNPTWNHEKGAELDLVTYSNCETVELFLNDRRIGRQKMSDFSTRKMHWYGIPYEAGTLKTVGYRDGKKVCETELKTAGKPERMKLVCGQEKIYPGAVCHVEVQLLDKHGNAVNHADRELEFEINGGQVIALDNGTLTALDTMKEFKVRTTSRGRCMAILKVDDDSSTLSLTVRGKGMKSATLSIQK